MMMISLHKYEVNVSRVLYTPQQRFLVASPVPLMPGVVVCTVLQYPAV